jgi:hypothetical protein
MENQPETEAPRTGVQTPSDYSHTPVIPLRNASLQRRRDKIELGYIATLSRARSRQEIREDSSRCGSSASTCIARKSPEAPLDLRANTDRDMGAGSLASAQLREADFSRGEPEVPVARGQRSSSGRSDSSTLWKRRSLGTETLRGLFPSMAVLSAPSRNREINRPPMREDEKRLRIVSPAHDQGKKYTSRWGWATWF